MKQQPNPLVPQGTFESQARGKSHVRIAVFTILAIHVVVLGALLIQGCKRDKEDTTANTTPTNDFTGIAPFGGTNDIVSTPPTSNPTPAIPPFSNPPTAVNTGASPTTSTSTPGISSFAPTTPTVSPTITPTPGVPAPMVNATETAGASEHVIVKGDTFATLAKKYGVSVKSIQNANPNLNPSRLRIGDKVKIPAKASTSSTTSGAASLSGSSGATSPDVYVVKSGDTLGKIAKANGTTTREIQRLNNLSTTQIKVGQKLKLPARASAPATATPNPAASGGLAPTATPPAGFSPAPLSPAPAQ
jgi:LysM repeat protein